MAQAAVSPAGAPTELNAVHADDDPLADPPEKRINFIPVPVNVESMAGVFTLDSVTHLLIDPNHAELKQLDSFFADMYSVPSGFRVPVSDAGTEDKHRKSAGWGKRGYDSGELGGR